MNAALENGNDHAARSQNGTPTVVPQLDSQHGTLDNRRRGSLDHDECESRMNTSPQQQETRKINVGPKESLADWGVVVCVFFSNLLTALDFAGFGVFYPHLVEHFEATTAAVAWCSSIGAFFVAIVALFATYPIKSYGCRLPGVIGCLLFSLGMSLNYFAPNLLTIYFTYGVIAGSGGGLVVLSASIILHQRFSRNRNLASGIGYLGFSFGSVIGPILTNYLIQTYSWRGAFLLLGAISVHRIALCLFFRTPKSLTLLSRHSSETKHRGISGQTIVRYLKETFDFSILRHARYAIYVSAYCLNIICMYGYLLHVVNRAISVGLSSDQGVFAMSLNGGVGAVSRVFVAFIANHPKVNSILVFAIGMFWGCLSIAVFYVDPGIFGTMTSSVFFGFYLGCTTTVFANVAVYLMGVALLPKSLAILQFISGLAAFASPTLVGWVFDVTGDYNKAFAIIGCMAFVSGCLMVALVFVTRCHRKSTEKDVELEKTIHRHPPVQAAGQT